jgi:CBS domain-containing protein
MNRAPITIGPEASLFDALVLMRVHDVSGLPVVDADQYVVGVLSQKDLTRSLGVALNLADTKGLLDVLLAGIQSDAESFLANLRRALEVTSVQSAMSHPAFVTQADASLELVMEVMSENSMSRLPVVERNRLVGIVTPTDLVSGALRTSPEKLERSA